MPSIYITYIRQWGNSLGVRIPKEALRAVALGENSTVDIRVHKNTIVMVRVAKKEHQSLSGIIADITPQNIHTAEQWGAPQGNEIW